MLAETTLLQSIKERARRCLKGNTISIAGLSALLTGDELAQPLDEMAGQWRQAPACAMHDAARLREARQFSDRNEDRFARMMRMQHIDAVEDGDALVDKGEMLEQFEAVRFQHRFDGQTRRRTSTDEPVTQYDP